MAQEDTAFNLFFSKPIFIGAHHDSFKQVEILEALVERINSLCEIRWSSPARAINGSYVTRRSAAGAREIRTYSNEGSLENQSECPVRFSLD